MLTSQHWHWPFFLALPVAIAVTMVTGVILGAPTLRVRGDYLAIVTLGFGEIIRITINNTAWLGASAGIKDIPSPPSIGPDPIGVDQDGLFQIPHLAWHGLVPSLDNEHKTPFLVFGVLDAVPYYWLLLTVLLIVLLADFLIKESRVGRAWEATREDEDAAELMGVPTFRYKLLAFAMGAAIGGLAGSMLASGQGGYINPTSFLLLLSMLFVAAVIIGGAGNRWGAVLGGVLVAYLPERFRALERLAAADLRREPDGDRVLPAAGPAAAPPHASRDPGPGRDRGAGEGRPSMPDGTADTRRALLEVDNVTIRFGGVTALDQVSFDIKEGEILGLIGPNGAGKTTCFNVMTGVYQATSGEVRFDGAAAGEPQAARHHQARHRPHLPEHPALQGDDRPGERDGRRRRAQQGRPAQRAVPHARCTAVPRRPPRGRGVRAARVRRRRRARGRAGREPLLRRPAPPRDRPGDGDQAEAAVPRRAGRRLQPGREGAS